MTTHPIFSSLTGDSGAGTVIVATETGTMMDQDLFDNLPVEQQTRQLYSMLKVSLFCSSFRFLPHVAVKP